MSTEENLEGRYKRIYDQLRNLLPKANSSISHMATVVALLHHKMPHFSWTGFYILHNGELTVGPYQGPLACQVLEKNRGVCWAGILRRSTIVVPDVHVFSDHIVCDGRSNSEIVVPLLDKDNQPWAVLDVDSWKFNAFSDADKKWLEKITELIHPI